MASELAAWARDVEQKVFEFWESEYSNWHPGVQVWFSPVEESRSILLIGQQPGGGEDDFEYEQWEKGTHELPDEHDYLSVESPNEFPLAYYTRKIVPDNLLTQSVKTNLNFFRAAGSDEWEAAFDSETRKNIKQFSFEYVDELRKKLDPDLIITEGGGVYDDLQSESLEPAWDFETVTEHFHTAGDNERTLYRVGRAEDYTIVGLKHPSAGRGLSNSDYREMRDTVMEIWKQIK